MQADLASSGLARNKTRTPPVEFTHISKSLMVRDPWDGPQINLRARFHGQLPTTAQTKYMGRETPGPRNRKISNFKLRRLLNLEFIFVSKFKLYFFIFQLVSEF